MPRSTQQGRSRRRHAMGAMAGAAAMTLLAACGGESGGTATESGGTATLTWYVNPDGVDQNMVNAERCSTNQYTIDVEQLPTDATQQRVQLARRLAVEDTGIDLMSTDPVFVPELANAGYLAEVPAQYADQTTGPDVLEGIAKTVQWEGKTYGFPQWANTQVLWYNKTLAEKAGLDMSQPVTWDQIIEAASAGGGTVGVQAKKYEAYAVLINALVMGAGGEIATNLEEGSDATVTLDSEAGREAARVVETLANSNAAQPDLSNSNEGTVEAYLTSGPGTFMVNWTYIHAAYSADVKDLGWARYPQTVQGQESRPPVGGIDITVSAFSEHPEYAMEAAACVAGEESQLVLAAGAPKSQAYPDGVEPAGLMPARASLYEHERVTEIYPSDLLALWRESIDAGGPRPISAVWNDMSLAIQSSWHAPDTVSEQTAAESAQFIADVLSGKALV